APICWKESEVNSIDRRAWTEDARQFFDRNYQPGTGIMFGFGDLAGILRESGIPLREGLHEGNGPAWTAAVVRPDLFLHQEWVLGFSGSEAASAARRGHYVLMKRYGPVEIWRRP